MKQITKEMIKIYHLKPLKYDFMGYTFNRVNELSFHHLIVPRKDCQKRGLGNGYLMWNGAILNQDTAHNYLHLIERIDKELFFRITKCMIEENINKKIDIDNLKRIREILLYFEEEYKEERDRNGKLLIKEPYKNNRIDLF